MTGHPVNDPALVTGPSAKVRLRERVLEDFNGISDGERRRWSQAVADRLLALPQVQARPGPLMLFLSMADEIDTDPLVRGALAAGHELYVPHTQRRGRCLVPVQLRCLSDVRTGAYGIREPRAAPRCAPADLAVVVVPAVAYDRQGYRLGRGGGYYDRFLPELSAQAFTCGVILQRHLFDEVPREAHDQAVQLVVTEQQVVCPRR